MSSDTFIMIAAAVAGFAGLYYYRSMSSPTPTPAYEGESVDMTGSTLLAQAADLQRSCATGDTAACVEYGQYYDQNQPPEAQMPFDYKF
jgi:hypothetical protein